MMDHVIECSSIYDIDFTAILYDYVYYGQENYTVYLNCSADVDTNYQREHISRLAIPLLCWEKDINQQFRQLHVPIDSDSTREEFLEALRGALDNYSQNGCNSDALIDLYNDMTANTSSCITGLECYMVLIEVLIQRVCGINVKVRDFSPIRQEGASEIKAFLRNAIEELSVLEDGYYKFRKGGRIELLVDSDWIQIKNFSISNKQVVFYDDKKNEINAKLLLCNETKARLRGPLETVALCELGTLIDLPWYLDACFSEDNMDGVEFISPISVVSRDRVSALFGGNDCRVCPSGYSLIEYYTPYVEKVLRTLLNENETIPLPDLEDWIQIINNYPISKQKIAKSLTSVKEYCDGLLQKRFNEATQRKFKIVKMQDCNYATLGVVLTNMCIILRYYRQISSKKSPYYNNPNCVDSYYRNNNLNEFYNDTIIALNKCKVFFPRFYVDCTAIDDFISLINSRDFFRTHTVSDALVVNDEFYHLVSKLEKSANEIIRSYYSIALFVSGVLLKANIFSLFCIIGDGKVVKCKIEEILEKRNIKVLQYKPLWYERISNG